MKKIMRLAINIDHIATLRNARGGNLPDPVSAARIAEIAGAKCIVCHLREDRRHIKDADVFKLRKSIQTKLDLEMSATPSIIKIAKSIKPDLCTLVPEHRKELTTESGLDVIKCKKSLKKAIENLHKSGIKVSLFIDPITAQINATKEIGADMMEIHTGEYANAKKRNDIQRQLKRIIDAAKLGKKIGLGVNAGHGLDYSNIKPISKITEIDEVSIGYAIITRSMFVGLKNAVKEMKKLLK
jgi:pyridoxine 5-phosphate synthase